LVSELTSAGRRAIGSVADILDTAAFGAAVDATIKAFGGVHVLVNNAAIFGQLTFKPFYEIGADEWDKVMAVNGRGTVQCGKAGVAPIPAPKYGQIHNKTSGPG